jgi:hypothetical protein
MKPLPAAVTLACLFQVGFVVAGTLFTRLFSNIALRHNEALATAVPTRAAIAWFIRSHGAWFLLVPLFCSVWAATQATQHQGEPELSDRNTWIILACTVVLGLLFLYSAISPWSVMFQS